MLMLLKGLDEKESAQKVEARTGWSVTAELRGALGVQAST